MHFVIFLKECNIKWDPISVKRLKHDVIDSFVEKMNKTIYEASTIVGWSNRKYRSFLGITGHFIDNKMEPQSYLIDFVHLKSPHTSENIHQITECVLDRFNIKDKLYKIVTDTASNRIKAYKFGLSLNGDETGLDKN
ncbi:unnamed protein product [Adineta steineri]|uniref:Uncharacterized protein n=1 Tax=Adineta steineri TaxID=433720 RepID=A0A813M483_9BILA|nr:unnamed protein product [Adineta steineri]CAF1101893.1 unnamed protein product [Adineta steineri]CAF3660105.1 unnamed protein product [Adineta steineri]CAF4175470.1 unnamed protein product [Adineta steineri]